MKVEILEDSLKEVVDGLFLSLGKGDTKTVPDKVGERWCKAGWAKDLEGNEETGERKPGAQKLEVDNAAQS